MTKERKEYILKIYRSYEENKRLLAYEATKREEDKSPGEKEYCEILRKEVEVVDKMLFNAGLDGEDKKKFIEQHLIKGVSKLRVSFDCYVVNRTLTRWKESVIFSTDKCLATYGI